MYAIFENPGDLHPDLLRSFGVSVKETQNPIGQFGTGLKYAIACFFRNNVPFDLITGGQRLDLGMKPTEIRGKTFNFVTLDDVSLGFTTDLGPHWVMWMAFREIYSNALDEGGRIYLSPAKPDIVPGMTYLISDDIRLVNLVRTKGRYFLQSERLAIVEHPYQRVSLEIHPRNPDNSQGFYLKSVIVAEHGSSASFTYNFTDGKLTEDRTFLIDGSFYKVMGIMCGKLEDKKILHQLLSADDSSFEGRIDYDHGYELSKEFYEVATELYEQSAGRLNASARNALLASKPPKIETLDLSPVQNTMLRRAMFFIAGPLKCPDIMKAKILCVESCGPSVLGTVRDGTIYLSRRLFDQGTKAVTSCLFEEFIHLSTGHSDCTYPMQTFLFDRIISLGEELQGSPL